MAGLRPDDRLLLETALSHLVAPEMFVRDVAEALASCAREGTEAGATAAVALGVCMKAGGFWGWVGCGAAYLLYALAAGDAVQECFPPPPTNPPPDDPCDGPNPPPPEECVCDGTLPEPVDCEPPCDEDPDTAEPDCPEEDECLASECQ
jgi:hypothetical protein